MFFCGRCDSSFQTKVDLAAHLRDHPDATPTMPSCGTCKWEFTDTMALQAHQLINGHTGVVGAAGEAAGDLTSESYYCDRCSTTFDTHRKFRRHRENGKPCCDANFARAWKNGSSKGPSLKQRASYVDLDAPKASMVAVSEYAPSVSSLTETYCRYCKTTFDSAAQFNRHALACKDRPRFEASMEMISHFDTSASSRSTTPQQARKGSPKKRNRGRGRSKSPLPPVQQSAHQPVAYPGSMGRSDLKHGSHGNLKAPMIPAQPASLQSTAYPGSVGRAGSKGFPVAASQQVSYQSILHTTVPHPAQAMTVNDEMANMQQAKFICGKIMRLMLQVDIFLHEAGEILVAGIGWARVPVSRQPEVVVKLNAMCHLPRFLQGVEYLPVPTILQSEYTTDYPIEEFQYSPDRDSAKPALDVVALSCIKIVLADGRNEVVKIAAVNVLTCQILMSHLVCTNPQAEVKNWNTATTGLSSFHHMEDARKAGFKILKGWSAARTALSKFVDKETIIVGHNLRADLDALRLIHGRAVDIVKVIEKAAGGPLSKAQVTLDSWCRDFVKTPLKTDPNFGRDCLTDAFATREIALRAAKFGEQFEKLAKQKSREYQSIGRV